MRTGKVEFLSKSSLALQILIFFNGIYQALFFLATLGIYIWKGVSLPYPDSRLGIEIFLLFAYELVEFCRLFIASKGNKTENIPNMIAFVLLSLFGVLANIYFAQLQIYV
jgi:transmembrane protein 216